MASSLNTSIHSIRRIKLIFAPMVYLDAPIEEDMTLSDVIQDERDHFEDIEHQLQNQRLREDLQRMMDEKLTDQEQAILKDYYAWDGGKQPTYQAAAEKYGVTTEGARQRITTALSKFRKFRRELINNYPELLMIQVYTQSETQLFDLKPIMISTAYRFLCTGDEIEINGQRGIISSINIDLKEFVFSCEGVDLHLPFKIITDIEMKNRKITKMILTLSPAGIQFYRL